MPISKENGEFRDIECIEVIWKAVLEVVNLRIGVAVDLHDTIHRFRARRGTGTASLEGKLLQKLTAIRE